MRSCEWLVWLASAVPGLGLACSRDKDCPCSNSYRVHLIETCTCNTAARRCTPVRGAQHAQQLLEPCAKQPGLGWVAVETRKRCRIGATCGASQMAIPAPPSSAQPH